MPGVATGKNGKHQKECVSAAQLCTLDTASNWPPWARYGVAVAGIGACTPFWWVAARLGEAHCWFVFYPAVVAAGCLGGLGPAVLATLLGSLAGVILSGWQPWVAIADLARLWPVGMLMGTGLLVGLLSERTRRARQQLQAESRACREAQTAIRQSQERYSALFDGSLDCVYLLDFDGHFIDANPAALNLMGYSREEISSTSMTTLLDAGQMPLAQQRMQTLISDGHTLLPAEFCLRRKNGEPVIVEARSSIILHDGKPVAVQGIARDITARKQAEAALRESEEKFRNLAENMHAGVGIVQETRFVYANRYMAEMLGYTVEEILCLDFPKLVDPTDRERLIELARRRQSGEAVPTQYQFIALTKSGERRWMDFSAAYTLYKGKPAIIGAAFDITEHKQAEQQLKAHARGLTLLCDSATRLLDAERPADMLREIFDELAAHLGANLYLNYLVADEGARLRLHAWRGLAEADSKEIECVSFGQTLCGVAAEEKRRVIVEEVQRTAQPKSDLVRKMGVRVYACHPLMVNSHVLGTLAMCAADRDRFSAEDLELMRAISHQAAMALEHQRLKAELERRASDLMQANHAKDHFMAMLSHELRTPLAPVLAATSVLERGNSVTAQDREYLEMIRRNVELEARLIDDLLDVTRIVRGKVELEKHPVELCIVVRRAVEVCKEDLEARRLHFDVDLGPAAPYWIEADAARLQQVFWNLLKNAIKFTPHDGCVGVRCYPEDGHVVTDVTDSGAGIDAEALTRIFNPFEQAERSITRQFGGLGLGLAISKALVEMHGGTIEASSEGKNKGATFRVRLPLAKGSGFGVQGSEKGGTPLLNPEPRTPKPLRILLVEDHGDTARLMRQLLSAEGHEVHTAGDVATALSLAAAQPFDLLISDLGLPDGSGVDLMRAIRAGGSAIPGIALSGFGQEDDVCRSREAGFCEHLIKPVSIDHLLETMQRLVRPK